MILPQQTKKFKNSITSHYKNKKRDFPWRNTNNPYHILVSEVMLQQTQTFRVLPKYLAFLKEFPTVESLARAPLSQVLMVWSGLGYNRRAQYLHQTAKILVEQYQGKIPTDPTFLDQLPGIGSTTAGAIVAFSYNLPVVFIETNIRRVFIHFFFPSKKKVSDKELLPLIKKTLDRENPREWYWALMDYGALLGGRGANPNRRSAHYTKQTPFEGSLRKMRGEIMRILLQHRELGIDELKRLLSEEERIPKALAGLKRDGLIRLVNQEATITLA